jgi:hypothetical protein
MKGRHIIFALVLLAFFEIKGFPQDSLDFKGQLSAYTHLNPDNSLPWWNGGRYIPELNYSHRFSDKQLFDLEASVNLYGNAGLRPFDSSGFNGAFKPYRLWTRYSTDQFELRLGLQKINFGSASILRPLMWFDQIDPRDPLKLTDGVWGILARYYFLNNTNIWLWGLYGNNKLKGWESFKTLKKTPEFGGRIQTPVPGGEAGLSYHHRTADCSNLTDPSILFDRVQENRFGLDARFDIVIGFWIEASWSHFSRDLNENTNQEIFNIGADYTFGFGNGLTVVYEQLLASRDKTSFHFSDPLTFSLITLSYPIGMVHNISAIVYYDWTNKRMYNFVNWQMQYNRFTFYLMGYINPSVYNIPTQGSGEILYAGSGIQLMMVFNH